jgi:hypothetical protein
LAFPEGKVRPGKMQLLDFLIWFTGITPFRFPTATVGSERDDSNADGPCGWRRCVDVHGERAKWDFENELCRGSLIIFQFS